MGTASSADGTLRPLRRDSFTEGSYANPVSLESPDQRESSVQRSWPHSRCRRRARGAYPASPGLPAPATTITRASSLPLSVPGPTRARSGPRVASRPRPQRHPDACRRGQARAWHRVPDRNGILMLAGASRMTTNHSTPMPSTTGSGQVWRLRPQPQLPALPAGRRCRGCSTASRSRRPPSRATCGPSGGSAQSCST